MGWAKGKQLCFAQLKRKKKEKETTLIWVSA